MATSDNELRAEVRDFTGIDSATVTDTEFDTVLNDAKRHVMLRASMEQDTVDWYGEPAQEEALNWATKLFLKVAAGELDSQSVAVGAIDDDTLLARDDDSVTVWYRNMERALKEINPLSGYGIRGVDRGEYGSDEEDTSGGISL